MGTDREITAEFRYGLGGTLDDQQRTNFWLNTHLEDDHLIWHGHRDADGYGVWSLGYVLHTCRAHRLAYEMLVGPIPIGLVLDHVCRIPSCVNPHHLEVVTNAENNRRGNSPSAKNSRKTHCKRGHSLRGYNLLRFLRPNGAVVRTCRTCAVSHTKRWRANHV